MTKREGGEKKTMFHVRSHSEFSMCGVLSVLGVSKFVKLEKRGGRFHTM